MKFTIQIEEAFAPAVDPQRIERALEATFHRQPPPPVETVSVVITDTRTVQQLNHRYRGLDAPTDVLAFANTPDPDLPPGSEALVAGHLGDIIIAYPVAEAQALAAGHTPAEETILLTVHGALHLLGFDHDTPSAKAAMWQAQGQIMAALHLAHLQPTEH